VLKDYENKSAALDVSVHWRDPEVLRLYDRLFTLFSEAAPLRQKFADCARLHQLLEQIDEVETELTTYVAALAQRRFVPLPKDYENKVQVMDLWIVGKALDPKRSAWELQGVFDSKAQAMVACRDTTYFVGTVPSNVLLPHDSTEWPEAFYPLLEPDSRVNEVK